MHAWFTITSEKARLMIRLTFTCLALARTILPIEFITARGLTVAVLLKGNDGAGDVVVVVVVDGEGDSITL